MVIRITNSIYLNQAFLLATSISEMMWKETTSNYAPLFELRHSAGGLALRIFSGGRRPCLRIYYTLYIPNFPTDLFTI